MVEKVTGYRVKGGQMIQDEESAIIAETMAEIISTIPELRLIADTVQANLKPLCLHMQQLASYYAKNHPEVLGETTPEPPLPGAIGADFWQKNASHLKSALAMTHEEVAAEYEALHRPDGTKARWEPKKGEWVDITFRPLNRCEAIQFSDQVVCEPCKLAWDVNDGSPPECMKLSKPVPVGEITSFRPSDKPRWETCVTHAKDEIKRHLGPNKIVVPFDPPPEWQSQVEPEDVICDCSALMNGDSYHSSTCSLQIARRVRKMIDAETPKKDRYGHWSSDGHARCYKCKRRAECDCPPPAVAGTSEGVV